MRTSCPLIGIFLLGALASALLVAQGNSPATPLTLVSRDGRRVVPTTIVAGQELIALNDLAALFQVTVREDPLAGGLTVTYRGRTVLISQDQAMASVGGRVVALPTAPVRAGNRWLVPIDVIPRAIAPIYDTRLDLRRPSRLLLVGDVRVPRVTGRVDSAGPPTRATLELTPGAEATTSVEGGRIIVRVEADALDAAFPAGAGLIDSIRVGDQPNTIVVTLSPRYLTARASPATADNVTRVTIEVTAAPAEAAAPVPPPPPPAGEPPSIAGSGATSAIVLDPGHGGSDSGVRAEGALEKEIALDVARRLKGFIEARLGLRVVMTREDDRAVTLDERAAIANNAKAGLFVSLHLNAAFAPEAAGAEVFTLKLDDESLTALEESEGVTLPVLGGRSRTIDVIPWDVAQARHAQDSEVLAATIEDELRKRVPMGPRLRRQAPLRVLGSVNMPAVLVEMAYLSNPDQAVAARSADFQGRLAEALFEAIARMRALLDSRAGQ